MYTVIGFYIDCRWCFVFINSHGRHVDIVKNVKFGSVKVMRTWMTCCVFLSVIANWMMAATAWRQVQAACPGKGGGGLGGRITFLYRVCPHVYAVKNVVTYSVSPFIMTLAFLKHRHRYKFYDIGEIFLLWIAEFFFTMEHVKW